MASAGVGVVTMLVKIRGRWLTSSMSSNAGGLDCRLGGGALSSRTVARRGAMFIEGVFCKGATRLQRALKYIYSADALVT